MAGLVDVSDIVYFFCAGEGKGESKATGTGGGVSVLLLKIPGGGGGFSQEGWGGGAGGCLQGIWGGGGGLDFFFRGQNALLVLLIFGMISEQPQKCSVKQGRHREMGIFRVV